MSGTRSRFWTPGTFVNCAFCPDSVATSILGDIDVRWRGAMNNWRQGTLNQAVVAKWHNGASQASWAMDFLTPNGSPGWVWSTTGVNIFALTSAVHPDTIFPLHRFSTLSIKVEFDVNNGAGGQTATFYASDDEDLNTTNWTFLDAQTTTAAGTTNMWDSTFGISIGAANTGGNSPYEGYTDRTQVRNGIGGTIVHEMDFGPLDPGIKGFTDAQGNVFTQQGISQITQHGPLIGGDRGYRRPVSFKPGRPRSNRIAA